MRRPTKIFSWNTYKWPIHILKKKYSASLIRKIQIKTMWYHLTILAHKSNRTKTTMNCRGGQGKKFFLVRMSDCSILLEKNRNTSVKLRINPSYDLAIQLLGFQPKDPKFYLEKTFVFLVHCSTICNSQNLATAQMAKTDDCIKKPFVFFFFLTHSYSMQYYLAMKRQNHAIHCNADEIRSFCIC